MYKATGNHNNNEIKVVSTDGIQWNPLLGSLNVSDTFKLTVNNSLRDFIIIHKGSPSAAYQGFDDGVLVLQKDADPNRQWHSSNVNDYANSTIHSWLNGEYFNSIDANIRNQIKQVKIPYRPGSGTSTTVSSGASGLSCKVFLLSGREVGSGASTYQPNEGVTLTYFAGIETIAPNSMRIVYHDSVEIYWWLRSPYLNNAHSAHHIWEGGRIDCSASAATFFPRPAFVLPSSFIIGKE